MTKHGAVAGSEVALGRVENSNVAGFHERHVGTDESNGIDGGVPLPKARYAIEFFFVAADLAARIVDQTVDLLHELPQRGRAIVSVSPLLTPRLPSPRVRIEKLEP